MGKRTIDTERAAVGADPRIDTQGSAGITSEERHRMIERSAFLRAAGREFRDGDAISDWLEAEAEVNQHLNGDARANEAASATDKPPDTD